MVFELKLRKIGNSAGVVLPKEALTYGMKGCWRSPRVESASAECARWLEANSKAV